MLGAAWARGPVLVSVGIGKCLVCYSQKEWVSLTEILLLVLHDGLVPCSIVVVKHYIGVCDLDVGLAGDSHQHLPLSIRVLGWITYADVVIQVVPHWQVDP